MFISESWSHLSFYQFHERKGLLTDIHAAKKCGHLHCMPFDVSVCLIREGSIELNETVGLKCVFQNITVL